ncbi:MAG: hypothetical protein ACRERC_15840 [Candidatus Binatia bacterium]
MRGIEGSSVRAGRRRRWRARRTVHIALALACLAARPTAGAPAPAGPEFQVNSYTAGDQSYPAACVTEALGRATLVWESRGEDGSGSAVMLASIGEVGTVRPVATRVNTTTEGDQQFPAVACASNLDRIVVWESTGLDGDDFGIAAQRYAPIDAVRGGQLQVNTHTAGRQRAAAVCADGADGFVVAWQSEGQDGDGNGIFAQRFDAANARAGGELPVNSFTVDTQQQPTIACTDAGGFVVVWQSRGQDGDGDGIFAQRFAADGARAGGEFLVNQVTLGNQRHAAIATDPAGGFVVAWNSHDDQDGDSDGVFARRFDAAGTAQGGEFQVNAYTRHRQEQPSIAPGRDGFTIAWSSGHDGDQAGVFARRFDATGIAQGGEFQVNTYTVGVQGALSAQSHALAAAGNTRGDLVIAWQSTRLLAGSQDGDGAGIFAQRFAPPLPACRGDCDGDGNVAIPELIRAVGLALDGAAPTTCAALDADANQRVSVAELIGAVGAALNGCPAALAQGAMR